MSFIINNLDSSRPNLPIGEILETQLRTEIASWKAYLDANSPNTRYGSMNVYSYRGELYWMTLNYGEEDFIRANTSGDPSNIILGAEIAKQIFNNLKRTAHQLYLPNLLTRFNSLYAANDTEEFDFNIKMVTEYNSFSGMYRTHFEGNGADNAALFPYTTGGNRTNNRNELLEWGGEYSIAFKYFGDISKSLEVAREGGYVIYSVVPWVFTQNGQRKNAGATMEIVFAQYNVETAALRKQLLLFNNANLTPENVTHLNDLPDDQNTYPGGAADKNKYPEDTDDGLNSSGYGTFDNTNDPVDFPSMPLWDATSTGFISMWNPTITELTDLYGFLWDSDIATTLKKLFLEPMDAIISLALFPVDPTILEGGKRHVTIGHVDTEIEMNVVQKQFVDFDFGTITLDEYYGAAWDYSPYTKVSIYLPYIGSQELDVDDVMNCTLNLKYRIDLLSGMCVAMLKATRTRDRLDAVVYTWQGNCAMQVPITAGSAREFINSIIQLGAMTGLALVQPGAGALVAAQHSNTGGDFEINAGMSNNWVNPAMATYSALNVLGQKVHVQRGGRVDANAGVMSVQSAFIVINRPVSAIPRGWNEFAGYPSLKIKELISQKGFTQVAYIKLNGLEATAEEITELDTILKGGVIL